MRWVGYEYVQEKRSTYRILVGKFERKRPPLILDVHGKIILEWI
jgi:hypothetical protein